MDVLPLDTVIQGDCLSGMRGLPDDSVDLIVADPPYNLSKGKKWSWDGVSGLPGMGGAWNKVMENWDDMSFGDYWNFTEAWLAQARRVLRPTGSMWIFGTYHNAGFLNVLCQKLGIEILNEVVWYKRNAFPNLSCRRLTASHETILWCHKGGKKRQYYFNYAYAKADDLACDRLKEPGKQMRTVWDIPSNKDPAELRFGRLPMQKPVRLLKRMLRLSSRPGDLVLAPFCGTGSECVAAKECGRHYLGFEVDGEACVTARERLRFAPESDEAVQLTFADTPGGERKSR